MAAYPNTPIMAEKSISPERALHMAHFPELYQAAHRNNELTIPGGSSGQGWRNFLANPGNYTRSLTAFGLGVGLTRQGEWMSAYMNGTKIPMHRIASKATKPTEIRVEEATSKKAAAAAKKIETAESEMRAAYKNGASEEEMERLHDNIDKQERSALRSGRQMKMKWVNFDDFMANHEKYFFPLAADKERFLEAYPTHEALVNKHNFTYQMRNNKDPLTPDKVREGASMLLGKSPENLEGNTTVVNGEIAIISSPVVMRSAEGLPLLAYGLNSLSSGELFSNTIVQSPTGDGYGIGKVGEYLASSVEFSSLDDALSSMNPAPSNAESITQHQTIKASVSNDEISTRGMTRR